MIEVSEKRFDEQEQEIAALRLLVEQRQAELASVMRANSNKLDTIKNLNGDVKLLQRDVALLRKHGAAASESLGRFVSDEGWGQADMDNMDSLDAALAATEPKE